MIKNKKLLGAIVLLAAACGKTNNKANGMSGSEINLENPIPVEMNASAEEAKKLDLVLAESEFLDVCGEKGAHCDGLWILRESRCNDEVVAQTFDGEALVLNIKPSGNTDLQFANGAIEPALFSINRNRESNSMVFTINEGTVIERDFLFDQAKGFMKVYLPVSDNGICAKGQRTLVYSRTRSEDVAGLLNQAAEIAAAKKAETQSRLVEAPVAPADVEATVVE